MLEFMAYVGITLPIVLGLYAIFLIYLSKKVNVGWKGYLRYRKLGISLQELKSGGNYEH